MPRHILVLADSLAYHGPESPEPPSDARLWPNVVARELAAVSLGAGLEVESPGTFRTASAPRAAEAADAASRLRTDEISGGPAIDLCARLGWTARDAWWAITKDPRCWGELIPRADALVIGIGGMDHLPAAIPTFLREGIPVIRPGYLRRRVRAFYQATAPSVIRMTRGHMRQLPQAATDAYLSRVVEAVRFWRPEIPIVALTPPPYDSPYYPVTKGHEAARQAALAWGSRHDVAMIDTDPLVLPSLRDGTANPDGMHWSWRSHEAVGIAVAQVLRTHFSQMNG